MNLSALKLLIQSFDTDNGVPEEVFLATKELLPNEESKTHFSGCIEATDGHYYLPVEEGYSVEEFWRDLLSLIVPEETWTEVIA